MRATRLSLVALGAQLVAAVPHGNQHRHPARELATQYSTVTDVVTVTANDAVVWVDQHNNVLSTEYLGQPTVAPVPTSVNSPPVVVPTSSGSSSPLTPPQVNPSNNVPASPGPPSVTTSQAVPSFLTSSGVPPNVPTSLPVTNPALDSSTSGSSSSMSSTTPGGNKDTSNTGTPANGGSGYGICYDLIGSSGCKDTNTMNQEFGFLVTQGFSKVRVYDIGCDIGAVATAAAAQGMQLIAGLNDIDNVAGDLGKLIGMIGGNWAPIDTIVIGNEIVNSGGSVASVAAALGVARPLLKAAGFAKSIVAVDTFIAHINNPGICQASDYCAINAHAYFDPNTAADGAGAFVRGAVNSVQQIANGKHVVVTESGWPWQGQTNGKAIPSPQNQQTAVGDLRSAFSGDQGDLFLFQAYDATYKSPGNLGVEQFFGIYGH